MLRMQTDRQNGFGIVELMVSLLVLAVLLFLAAPGFSNLIKDNRMLTEVYTIRAALNSARSEALAQRSFVTLCRSSDGANCSGDWEQGYIGFVDINGDGIVNDPGTEGGDRVFLAQLDDSHNLGIKYSNVANRVRFDSQGYATNFSGIFTLCDDRGMDKAHGLAVTPGGMVRAAEEGELDEDYCP